MQIECLWWAECLTAHPLVDDGTDTANLIGCGSLSASAGDEVAVDGWVFSAVTPRDAKWCNAPTRGLKQFPLVVDILARTR
ncbi:hypothetical protein A5766_06735 [Gordonia sp. 852002-51296_SCH5728562-b]|nr:hypothetical protein A5766_06735 [Gordonia sp. 852002-51296_SCH5728562-b]